MNPKTTLYNYKIFLFNKNGEVLTEIDTEIEAKDEIEADILIKRKYPTSKGYSHQIYE